MSRTGSSFDNRICRTAAVSVTALAAALWAMPAGAVEYKFGEVSGSVDTILSAGAQMRTSERDCENVGYGSPESCLKLTASGTQSAFRGTQTDDGNLNYDQWDVFSGAMKATSEILANWRNFGAFVRGTAIYDPLVTNTDYRDLNSPQASEVERNAKLYDYFVTGSFNVGELPLEVKLGNQVISWGESTFIQNGLSQINPIDVAAARRPGSELKEFFTPILAARASMGLPNDFSIDGFYQFKSDNIVPDPSGTFFSSADFIGRGSQPLRGAVFDRTGDDRFAPFLISSGLDIDTVQESILAINYPAVSIERANDKNADDGGEFGVSLRYFASELNQGTEFGLFFMNLHSRLPIIELSTAIPAGARDNVTALAAFPGEVGSGVVPALGATPGIPARNSFDVAQGLCNLFAAGLGAGGLLAANGVSSANAGLLGPFTGGPADIAAVQLVAPGGYTNCNNMAMLINRNSATIDDTVAATMANTQTFRLHYPEDIKVLGLSLSTTIGPMAVQGEVTYRRDQPFNYAFAEMAALSNDLDGQTRFRTRVAQAGGIISFDPTGGALAGLGVGVLPQVVNPIDAAVPAFSPLFLTGLNQSAARTGELTFATVAAAQDAAIPLFIRGGPIGAGIAREVPAALADAAAAGTLTAAAILANPGFAANAFPDAALRAAQVATTSNIQGHIAIDALGTNARTFTPTGTPIGGGFIAPPSAIITANPADISFAMLAPGAGAPGGVPIPLTVTSAIPVSAVGSDGFIKPAEEDVFTAQTTLTSVLFGSNPFVQFAGADQGITVTEIGMVMVPGISTNDGIAGGNTRGLVNTLASQNATLNPDMLLAGGYATKFSWGLQGLLILNYNRAFGSPVNLSPTVAWKWDMGGNTPATFGNYQAERKALTLGVTATYLANWSSALNWTTNFGPDAPLADRDFASFTISYAF